MLNHILLNLLLAKAYAVTIYPLNSIPLSQIQFEYLGNDFGFP